MLLGAEHGFSFFGTWLIETLAECIIVLGISMGSLSLRYHRQSKWWIWSGAQGKTRYKAADSFNPELLSSGNV